MKKEIKKIIEIPERVEVKIDLPNVIVSGPLGEIKKEFKGINFEVKKQENKVLIEHKNATKKEKKTAYSFSSHIENMIKGVLDGFEYKLQICSVHFPMTAKVDKMTNIFRIKNFLGENKERTLKLIPNVEVDIKGDLVIVKSINKETAGQQAANIERLTRVRGRDRRIFQDGIWIIKKEKGRMYK